MGSRNRGELSIKDACFIEILGDTTRLKEMKKFTKVVDVKTLYPINCLVQLEDSFVEQGNICMALIPLANNNRNQPNRKRNYQ